MHIFARGKMNSTTTGQAIKVITIILACVIIGQLYMFTARTLYENTANRHWQGKRYLARVNNPQNYRMVDSCIRLLHTGDLVVRRGDDMTSYMLSRLNTEDKTYSHCGLVLIEDGYPFVYHSIGGEDNPDQVIRRDSAAFWWSPANNHAFAAFRYDMTDTVVDKLVRCLYGYYQQKLMFDMDFDMATDERMYCSEMIYKAITAATGDSSYIPLARNYGRIFAGVDNLYRNTHAVPVCQIKFK